MKSHEYKTDSVTFWVYDQYIIAEPKSYIDVYKKEVEQLHEVVSKHIKGNFGLIENRINKNTVNPMVYRYAEELMPTLSAFAPVVYTDISKKVFEVESCFIDETSIKYKMFSSLSDAEKWMKEIL